MVYISPRVSVYAVNHAEDPFKRVRKSVYSKPITIGDRV